MNSLKARIWAQFARPQGWMGWIVGHLLAWKNAERSEWVLSLLKPAASDRILEVGFGSGADLERVGRVAARVAGVDHSETMVRMASRRNRLSVAAGRMELRLGLGDQLPFEDKSFDKVYAINVAQFSRQLDRTLAEWTRVLRPAGLLVVAVQPRSQGANETTATEVGERLRAAMIAVGLAQVTVERKAMRPVSTVCALGLRP